MVCSHVPISTCDLAKVRAVRLVAVLAGVPPCTPTPSKPVLLVETTPSLCGRFSLKLP